MPEYPVYFSDLIASRYKPIVFSNVGLSDDPASLYYRIVGKNDPEEYCIQYFFYWKEQQCLLTSHRYDYEPIFVYLESKKQKPICIVNGGLGGIFCGFHKTEIRPRDGKRDRKTRNFKTNLSPKPHYPFGKTSHEKIEGCYQTYPLKGNKDLTFEKLHPKFGICFCSNVFSGSRRALKGKRYDPPLKKLTDKVLKTWYFDHYKTLYDMPFGHDIASPFTLPFIKYKLTKEKLPTPKRLI